MQPCGEHSIHPNEGKHTTTEHMQFTFKVHDVVVSGGVHVWGSWSLLFYSTELCCVCDWRCASVFTLFWALTGQPWEMRSFTRGRSPTRTAFKKVSSISCSGYTQQQSDSFHRLQVEPLTLTPHYSEWGGYTLHQHFGCRHQSDTP